MIVGYAEPAKRIVRVVSRQIRFAYRDNGEEREQDAEASQAQHLRKI